MVISTFPDRRALARIANRLVGDGTAACVNISRISSVYSWGGRTESAAEYLAIFKTSQGNKGRLKRALAELHPYDVPEIAEIDVSSVNPAYARWVADSTRPRPPRTAASRRSRPARRPAARGPSTSRR